MTDSKETKKATAKKVTVRAIIDFKLNKDETGTMTLWGIVFTAKDGKLTTSLPADEAKAMIECGRCE